MAARIEDYAIIGDTKTVALVDSAGSIDWWCVPRVDSGACFAALLGEPQHGRWLLRPKGEVTRSTRRYVPETLVLETEYETPTGTVVVSDFMSPEEDHSTVFRIVEGRAGSVEMEMELIVRFDYGSVAPWVQSTGDGLTMVAGSDALRFHSPVPLIGREDLATTAEFTVGEGHVRSFSLSWYSALAAPPTPLDAPAARAADAALLAGVGRALHLRRRVARRSRAVADHGEGAVVLADRRGDRRGHDLAAGADRRRPQLGLPVLVAPGRVAHAAVAPLVRLHRRGRGLAAVAAARGGRPSR